MTVQAATSTRNPTRLLLIAATAAALLMALSVSLSTPTFASHTGPLVAPFNSESEMDESNPDCDDVAAHLGTTFDDEEKFDPPTSGTQGNVTLTNSDPNASFQTAAGWLVAVAIMKGGEAGANVYDYTGFSGGGVDHDNNLVTPNNPSGQPAGISHVTFCLVEGTAPSESPEGSVGGGTGTPAASLPDGALVVPSPTGMLATLLFGLILIASLGALAYANVRSVQRRG